MTTISFNHNGIVIIFPFIHCFCGVTNLCMSYLLPLSDDSMQKENVGMAKLGHCHSLLQKFDSIVGFMQCFDSHFDVALIRNPLAFVH